MTESEDRQPKEDAPAATQEDPASVQPRRREEIPWPNGPTLRTERLNTVLKLSQLAFGKEFQLRDEVATATSSTPLKGHLDAEDRATEVILDKATSALEDEAMERLLEEVASDLAAIATWLMSDAKE